MQSSHTVYKMSHFMPHSMRHVSSDTSTETKKQQEKKINRKKGGGDGQRGLQHWGTVTEKI